MVTISVGINSKGLPQSSRLQQITKIVNNMEETNEHLWSCCNLQSKIQKNQTDFEIRDKMGDGNDKILCISR